METRAIKTKLQYDKGSLVEVSESMEDSSQVIKTYKVIISNKMFNYDDDEYYYTLLEEIKGLKQ